MNTPREIQIPANATPEVQRALAEANAILLALWAERDDLVRRLQAAGIA